ncbi:hypothetical protein VTN77DRAFT_9804 [Rasamsonia byssochlamydoides]|uniref:uncharacterized protein n=1 Tax=Rasamsonia byssochlamydoides TaxID=89139 RepID=UPI0037445E46
MSSPSDTGAQLPIRRSATVPTRLIPQNTGSNGASNPSHTDDELLFFHPSAKIVHFAPQTPPDQPLSNPSSADFDYPVDTIETLPWRSPTERTVAIGRLRLEKVPGSTVFLKCGTVVKAILKNSQCWCVDGQSTFVLRIRALTYYRIELPNQTEEDAQRVAQLKDALSRVLRYEVTPCPFQRGFSVEIPVEARTPKKKKAWRPKERRESAPTIPAAPPKWLGENDLKRTAERPRTAGYSGNATDDSGSTVKEVESDIQPSAPIDIAYQPRSPTQSVTEQQSVNDLLARFQPIPESDNEAEATLSSSGESFHSFRAPVSPLPPSPPPSIAPSSPPRDPKPTEILYSRQRAHRYSREISEITITPEFTSSATQTTPTLTRRSSKAHTTDESEDISPLTSPSLRSLPQSDVVATAVSAVDGVPDLSNTNTAALRLKALRKRELSPMPPPSTLTYPAPRDSGKPLAASIFEKTCSLVLVPPLQLLLLLIHIAARIAAGPTVQSAASDSSPKLGPSLIDDGRGEDDFGVPTTPKASFTPGQFRRDEAED